MGVKIKIGVGNRDETAAAQLSGMLVRLVRVAFWHMMLIGRLMSQRQQSGCESALTHEREREGARSR